MPVTIPNFANAPTAYLRANNLLQKKPIYIVSFGPITGPLGTNYQPLADEYCTGRVLNPTKARKALMSYPSGYSSEFNPVTYASTLSSVTFDIMDNNPQYPNEATRLITNYVLKNRWVTIKRGFLTVNEADYAIIYAGQINNVKMNQQQTGYTFEVIDPRKQMTKDILGGHTALIDPYTTGNSFFQVSDTSGFANNSTTPSGSCVTSYLLLGNNIFSYTGISNSGSIADGGVLWQYVSPGGPSSAYSNWIFRNPYFVGDIVFSNGEEYQYGGLNGYAGLTAPHGIPVFADGPGIWVWRGYNSGHAGQWQPGVTVAIGDLVSNYGSIYVCTGAGVTAGSGGPIGDGSLSGGGDFTGLNLVQPNGQGISPASNQSTGSNIDNLIRFKGHPIDIILGILLSTGQGTNNPTNTLAPTGIPPYSITGLSNYDVNPGSGGGGSPTGIGIPWWQVNIPNFVAQKALMGSMTFVGFFTETTDALKFIEDYILPVAHIGLYVNRNGQIDCKAVLEPADYTGAITLDETNIVGIPTFDANLQTGGYFYNQPYISYDYKVVEGYYQTIRVDNLADSWGSYQEVSQLPIDGRMFDDSNPSFNGSGMAALCSNTYLDRFAFPPPVLTIKTFDMMTLLDPFSPVVVNHKAIPNFQTGSRGGPINCQVIKVNPEWDTGAMTVTLLAFGWYD